MAAGGYDVIDFDLSVLRNKEPIGTTRGNPVATVVVIRLPAGADVSVTFAQGQAWPLLNQGMQFKLCPAVRDGVFLSNPVGGGILTLGVSYGDTGGMEATR
jgi:hypothetical protein